MCHWRSKKQESVVTFLSCTCALFFFHIIIITVQLVHAVFVIYPPSVNGFCCYGVRVGRLTVILLNVRFILIL